MYRHVYGFCWMEIVCVLCFALVFGSYLNTGMDQPRKRKSFPVGDHFDLIKENKVNEYSVLISTFDHFSFRLFQFLSIGYLN